MHDLTEFSHHCLIETVIKCSPYFPEQSSPPTNPLTYEKFMWNQTTSASKLSNALKSGTFQTLKNNILKKNYDTTTLGTKLFTSDVEKITTFLHKECCDSVFIGKKRHNKFSKPKRKPWFSEDCQTLRARARRAANFLSRNPFNPTARDEYRSACNKYRKCLKKAKKTHRDLTMHNLNNSIDRKELWSILAELRSKKATTPIPMHDLEIHFNKLLNNAPKKIPENKIEQLNI